MKLKKLLAVTLAGVMIFTVPAYANEPEAVAAYQEMQAKSQEINEMNVVYDYHVAVSSSGISMDANMQMTMQATNLLNPDALKMNMDAVMTMGKMTDKSGGPGAVQEIDLTGIPITYNYYYENGMYYIDMMGSKVKYPMPLGEAMKAMRTNTEMMNMNPEYLRDMTLRTEGGNRILSYAIDPDQLNTLLQQIMSVGGMNQMMQTDGTALSYREVGGEYIIRPDGTYTNAKMGMVVDMSAQGKDMTMDIDLSLDVVDPGQPVVIQTPNLAEYRDAQPVTAQ